MFTASPVCVPLNCAVPWSIAIVVPAMCSVYHCPRQELRLGSVRQASAGSVMPRSRLADFDAAGPSVLDKAGSSRTVTTALCSIEVLCINPFVEM